MWSKVLVLFLSLCALPVAVRGGIITPIPVTTSSGTVESTTGFQAFSVNGPMMAGIHVTAYLSDNTSQTQTWSTTGGSLNSLNDSPGVTGFAGTGYWTLVEKDDTFLGWWTLMNYGTSLGITRITIDGLPAKVVFDLNVDTSGTIQPGAGRLETVGTEGTFGSATGHTFEYVSDGGNPVTDAVNAVYTNEVELGAGPPVGDVWNTIDITFSSNAGGMPDGSMFIFQADTDIVLNEGTPPPAPEPSSIVLLGGLLAAGAGCLRARRQRPA